MQEVWSARELASIGLTERRLARAVAEGSVRRIRRDNYCAPGTPEEVVAAVRIGGRVGCVSALRLLGIWVSRSTGLHVHLDPHAGRLRSGTATLHWSPAIAPGSRSRVAVLDALLTAMLCQSLLDAVASIDSALHQGLVSLSELRLHAVDPARRRILRWVDGRAESGVESIIRVALMMAGLHVEIQVRLSGVGRVDLVVERCIVVEVDGAAYHSGARRQVDHRRDAAAAARGLTPLRFSAAQVLYELPSVLAAVIAAVAAHRGAGFSGDRARIARNRANRALSS